MAILADADSRILIQGVAGRLARFQCEEMIRHSTKLVGIVARPDEFAGWTPPVVPVFQTAEAAVKATGANLIMIFSPPLEVKAAVSDAIAARLPVIVCLTDHVPVHDAIVLRSLAERAGVVLVGASSSGLLSPVRAKAGFFVEDICQPGDIGVVAKGGSLAYAVISELKSAGLGVSTVVSLGGDAAKGLDFAGCLALFAKDEETRAVVMLGEIGGSDEEKAAAYLQAQPIHKPVVAFISGRSVPVGRSMGHAGAIAALGRGDYDSKCRALAAAGVEIADTIGAIPQILARQR
jgi:succinyl-CoA synthetase alpha subunit